MRLTHAQACHYDLLLRVELEKDLENNTDYVHVTLCSLNRDMLCDARQKVDMEKPRAANRAANQSGKTASSTAKRKEVSWDGERMESVLRRIPATFSQPRRRVLLPSSQLCLERRVAAQKQV